MLRMETDEEEKVDLEDEYNAVKYITTSYFESKKIIHEAPVKGKKLLHLHEELRRKIDDDDNEYLVERVLDHKMIDGKLYYQILWAIDKSITWEPDHNIKCAEKAWAYHKRLCYNKKK